jgi:hypothetical protein
MTHALTIDYERVKHEDLSVSAQLGVQNGARVRRATEIQV